MYSPRINEDLIPVLYKLAKHEGKPMTKVVDNLIRDEANRRLKEAEKKSVDGCQLSE